MNVRIIMLFLILSNSCRNGNYGSKTGINDSVLIENMKGISYEEQLEIFNSLGYEFNEGVTPEILDLEIGEKAVWDNVSNKEYIENNPFSALYYLFGWRNPDVPNYNFTEKCIHFDLEFFDPNSQYKWFMERMGAITNGEIRFSDISIVTDSMDWEWIHFKVNGLDRKWKLEKTGFIADHFVQRFSHLTKELNTKGRYTYFSDGGQQWVNDYATEEEQSKFIARTGLNREWLGEGNHFNEPPSEINDVQSSQNVNKKANDKWWEFWK